MASSGLLIIGHGRHGKDTVAEILRDYYGAKFVSSSLFVARECLWEKWGRLNYCCISEMYEDRHNHRKKWADMVTEYNYPDRTRTFRGMLDQGNNVYVGMRMLGEYLACKHEGLISRTIWVDRHKYLPPEPLDSMNLWPGLADHIVNNNGTLNGLKERVCDLADNLVGEGVL